MTENKDKDKATYPPEFIDALRFDAAKRFNPAKHQRVMRALGLINHPTTINT